MHKWALLSMHCMFFVYIFQLIMLICWCTSYFLLSLIYLSGSSRQFAGFSTEVEDSIILHIWKRAGDFIPKLKELSLKNFIKNRNVRVGLRPYMPDGKPVIGHVPGLSNMFLATGHEGGGLSMALGTAEMVVDMVLGNPTHVDNSPFAAQGRCC
ncbi:FAD dependent oxidoreductase - like 1 [Theobroma cacao]|nr:FAD dependent oxidoreductase - like 1 [Theobroma cacao]